MLFKALFCFLKKILENFLGQVFRTSWFSFFKNLEVVGCVRFDFMGTFTRDDLIFLALPWPA